MEIPGRKPAILHKKSGANGNTGKKTGDIVKNNRDFQLLFR